MGQNERTSQKAETPDQGSFPTRPTRVRYEVLATACLLALVNYIHRNGFAAAGSDIKKDLGLNDEQLGYLMSAFLLAYGGFEVPAGVLGDRLGVRHLLAIIVLGWSILTGSVALVVLLPAVAVLRLGYLLVARFLFGMFQAGGFPALSRLTADWMPIQERATAQGLIWTASRAGGALAPFLMVWLIALYGSWQTPFLVIASLGVIWCLAFWPWFRNRPEDMPQVNSAERQRIVTGRAPHAVGHGNVPWARMLGSVSVWSLCLMYGFGGFSATFFITLLPAYLRDHRHLSPQQMTWLSGLPLACGIVACLGGGLLSDRIIRRTGNRKWGRRLNGSIGGVLAGVALLSTNWVEDVWLLGALLCVTFFCNDLAMGPAWAAAADIGERYAGTLGGAMNMIGNLMAAAGSIVAGTLFDRGLPTLVFLIFACSFWMGSLCWQGVDVTKTLAARD